MNSLPASPCIDVCELDTQQICRGCRRTIDEIADWPSADAARREQILQNCQQRQPPKSHD